MIDKFSSNSHRHPFSNTASSFLHVAPNEKYINQAWALWLNEITRIWVNFVTFDRQYGYGFASAVVVFCSSFASAVLSFIRWRNADQESGYTGNNQFKEGGENGGSDDEVPENLP